MADLREMLAASAASNQHDDLGGSYLVGQRHAGEVDVNPAVGVLRRQAIQRVHRRCTLPAMLSFSSCSGRGFPAESGFVPSAHPSVPQSAAVIASAVTAPASS